MTNNLSILVPEILAPTIIVMHYLPYFPTEHSLPLNIKIFSGKYLNNKPVPSTSKLSLEEKPGKMYIYIYIILDL